MTEKEMREMKAPGPKSWKELETFVKSLEKENDDYGKAVYCVSLAATAMFNFMASKCGITGFQASCADMDVLARTRGWTNGFFILNYDNLLYPQCYWSAERFPTAKELLRNNLEHLSERSKKNLEESPNAHPDVVKHWKAIANKDLSKL